MADKTPKKPKTSKKPTKTAKAPAKTVRANKPAATSKKTVSKPAAVAAKPKVQRSPLEKLRLWNIGFAAVLIAQAILVVVFASSQAMPITTQYSSVDALASEAAGHEVFALATRHLADVQLSWIIAAFLVVFALVYAAAATVLRTQYEIWLSRGVNKLRWVGLGLGGSLMTMAIAVVGGASDLGYLALIGGSIGLAALCALALELLGPGRHMARLLGVGAIVGAALPWLLFAGGLASSGLFDGAVPIYLYYVYASMFLLAVAFGLATFLRNTLRGRWVDAMYTERMFMALGFVGATLLAWQLFAGVR